MTSMRNRNGWVHLIAVLTLLVAASQATAAVQVKVFEAADATGATYYYRVVNTTDKPIVGLRVGFDYLHGESQLTTTPAGWTLQGGLAPSSSTSPAGWTAILVTTEESNLVDMEWSSDGGSQYDIAPGATKTGFSVRLAQTAAEYRTSLFDVILGDSTHVYGSLEPDSEGPPPPSDTTPPTISVTLTPSTIWPPDKSVVTVTATIQVSDNVDPNPTVKLVSITCIDATDCSSAISGAAIGTDDRQFSVVADRAGQQKEGRAYTVVYRATDASGNHADATATVRVPHDQR